MAEDIGRARSLPQLNYNYRWMRNEYESNQPTVNFTGTSSINFESCANASDQLACLIQGLLGVEIGTQSSTYTSTESSLTLSQVIYDPDVGADRNKGRARAVQAAAEMAAAEKELMVRVLDAYLDVLGAEDEARLALQQLESIAAQQMLAQRRYELGVGRETEVYDAQAAYDMQVMAYETARAQHFVALHKLSQITGVQIEGVQRVSPRMPVELPYPDNVEEWVEKAMQRNDSIKAAEAVARISVYEMRRHRAARFPRVNLAANYHERELRGGQGFTPASETTSVGVDIHLPLYRGGAISAGKRQAAYREMEASDKVNLQRNNVQTAMVSALLMTRNEVERFQARQRAVNSSRKSLEITERSYTEGGSTLLDLLQVQKNYYEARQQLSRARYDYIRRMFEIKQLAGILSMDDIRQYNAWFQPEN